MLKYSSSYMFRLSLLHVTGQPCSNTLMIGTFVMHMKLGKLAAEVSIIPYCTRILQLDWWKHAVTLLTVMIAINNE